MALRCASSESESSRLSGSDLNTALGGKIRRAGQFQFQSKGISVEHAELEFELNFSSPPVEEGPSV